MSIVPVGSISPQDLLRLEREAGVEFLDGHIVEKRVSIESSRIEMRIGRLLGNEAEKSKVAEVFGSSMGYQCFSSDPTRIRKPDVSVVRAERLTAIDPEDGFMPIPADLAVEVVSPNDRAYEIAGKIEEYLRNGFPLIWVVHPNTRTVQIYRSNGSGQVLHEQDEITGEGALPDFRCKVGDFFEAI